MDNYTSMIYILSGSVRIDRSILSKSRLGDLVYICFVMPLVRIVLVTNIDGATVTLMASHRYFGN